MVPFTRILCPIDFSEPSYKALKVANDLAKSFSSELILINVLSPIQHFPAAPAFPAATPATGALAGDLAREIEGYALESLETALKERVSDEIGSKSLLLRGNPAEEIAKYARENDVSIIIMGTHGITGWRHLLIGSVTEKVVRISSCPVLTIPADQEE